MRETKMDYRNLSSLCDCAADSSRYCRWWLWSCLSYFTEPLALYVIHCEHRAYYKLYLRPWRGTASKVYCIINKRTRKQRGTRGRFSKLNLMAV